MKSLTDCQAKLLNQYWCHTHELITSEEILHYSFTLLSEGNVSLGEAHLGFVVDSYSTKGDGESGTVQRPVKGHQGGFLVMQVTVKQVEDVPDGLRDPPGLREVASVVSEVPEAATPKVALLPPTPVAAALEVPSQMDKAKDAQVGEIVRVHFRGSEESARYEEYLKECDRMRLLWYPEACHSGGARGVPPDTERIQLATEVPKAVAPSVPVAAVPEKPVVASCVPVASTAPEEVTEAAVPVVPVVSEALPKVPAVAPTSSLATVVPEAPAMPEVTEAAVPEVPATACTAPEVTKPAVPVIPVVAAVEGAVEFAEFERIFLTVVHAQEMPLCKALRLMANGDPDTSWSWMKAHLGCLGAFP